MKKSEKQNISEKIKDLKAGVEWFYGEEFRLEDASERYEELAALAKGIEKDLAELKNKVTVVAQDFSKEA